MPLFGNFPDGYAMPDENLKHNYALPVPAIDHWNRLCMEKEECSVTRGELTRLRALQVEISRLKVLTEGRALETCLLSGAVLAGAFDLVGLMADSGEAMPNANVEEKLIGFPVRYTGFSPLAQMQRSDELMRQFLEERSEERKPDYPDQGRIEGEYP